MSEVAEGQRRSPQDPGQGCIAMATLTIGGEMGVFCILYTGIMHTYAHIHTRLSITSVLFFGFVLFLFFRWESRYPSELTHSRARGLGVL